jgi:hypothetical protein
MSLPDFIGRHRGFFSGWLARAILAALAVLPLAAYPAGAGNRMAGHPSPYLAQHAADPVQWREWGGAALEEGRRANRLVLVSIGYFACHWCHVMQRETWADVEAARLINTHFVAVKVDKELNAALDGALQAFSKRTRGVAGWPLNVFLTPEGYPLFAMTYAPRAEFLRIAEGLAERWGREAPSLAALARQAAEAAPRRTIADLPRAFRTVAMAEADTLRGGFQETAKFPMVPQLQALFDIRSRDRDPKLDEFLRLTLEQMRAGGLRDHVAGGFFRYTVDPDWHEPHFEKMLYDNAQLAELYLRAAEEMREPAYRHVGLETLDFMLAEMGLERGRAAAGFVASLSALDGQGREGGAYLWDREGLRRLLSEQDFALARRLWALDRAAVFEAGYLPLEHRAPSATERAQLRRMLGQLREARRPRIIPRDEKVLAGWNGLALAALAAAAHADARYRREADALYAYVSRRLWDGRRLLKGWSAGKPLSGAELADYAYVAYGVERYAAATGRADAREMGRALVREAWRRFHDGRQFRMEEAAVAGMLRGPQADPWEDGPTPAPAEMLTWVTGRLGDRALAGQARQAARQARQTASGNPFWRASLARPSRH